jgi:cysteine desulfurase family protein
MMPRIYLDNAATSWPKPPQVYEAMQRYAQENGAPAGRGVYQEACEAERIVQTARQRVAQLFQAPSPQRIVFTHNCTEALNLALFGLLRPGQRVLTSAVEHNSVLRPLRHLEQERQIQIEYLPCDAQGGIDLDGFRSRLAQVDLLVLNHASNVTGAILPLAEIADDIKASGVTFLLDAAQTAGVIPLNVQQLGIHLLATSGHKGLLGPLGTGVLYLAPEMEQRLVPLRFGGTGTRSEEEEQPRTMPDGYEAGNANVPGIAGLNAGVAYVLEETPERIAQHEARLVAQLITGLRELPGVQIFGPPAGSARVGVVAFTVAGYDPHEFATLLDTHYRIQVRSGLHCAPRIHRYLNLLPHGTIRMSVGPFTTVEAIETTLTALREVLQ